MKPMDRIVFAMQCVVRFAASSGAGRHGCAAHVFSADGRSILGQQVASLGMQEFYQTAMFEGLIMALGMALENGFHEVQVETYDQILADQVGSMRYSFEGLIGRRSMLEGFFLAPGVKALVPVCCRRALQTLCKHSTPFRGLGTMCLIWQYVTSTNLRH
jgi:hypothetical protein